MENKYFIFSPASWPCFIVQGYVASHYYIPSEVPVMLFPPGVTPHDICLHDIMSGFQPLLHGRLLELLGSTQLAICSKSPCSIADTCRMLAHLHFNSPGKLKSDQGHQN
jgi:hypothetical protein